jgi:hypothetical protein
LYVDFLFINTIIAKTWDYFDEKSECILPKQLIWQDIMLVLVIKLAGENTFTFDHPRNITKNVVYVVTLSYDKESVDEETRGNCCPFGSVIWYWVDCHLIVYFSQV